MHRLAVLLALAAACGANTGHVAGIETARDRDYAITLQQGHAALAKVLTSRFGYLVQDDGRTVLAPSTCRTRDGDGCFKTSTDHIDPDSQHYLRKADPSIPVGMYRIQVSGYVAGSDGEVWIVLHGHATDDQGHDYAMSTPDAPAWLAHEVDEVRVAVDKELAR